MTKTLIAALTAGTVLAVGFAPAQAADVYGKRVVTASYAQAPNNNLPLFIVGGAIVGGVAAAVFCPPCMIGHAVLTTGGAVVVGVGVGAATGLGTAVVLNHGNL